MLGRELHAGSICGRQELVFASQTALPHRTDRVNDVACLQPKPRCELGGSSRTRAYLAALRQKLRTCCAMNRAIYAPAARQGAVRGVNDGVDGQGRDVHVDDFDLLCPVHPTCSVPLEQKDDRTHNHAVSVLDI